MKVEDNIPPRG